MLACEARRGGGGDCLDVTALLAPRRFVRGRMGVPQQALAQSVLKAGQTCEGQMSCAVLNRAQQTLSEQRLLLAA